MSLGICIAYITKNHYCFCAYSYEIIHLIKYGSIFDVISAPIFARDSGWSFMSFSIQHIIKL